MANIYKSCALLDSDKVNNGRKRLYISYQDSVTLEIKSVQKLYSDFGINQSKYDDVLGVLNAYILSGTSDLGLLEEQNYLRINYTDIDGVEKNINKVYSTDLTQIEKDKFDALKNYAISLIP